MNLPEQFLPALTIEYKTPQECFDAILFLLNGVSEEDIKKENPNLQQVLHQLLYFLDTFWTEYDFTNAKEVHFVFDETDSALIGRICTLFPLLGQEFLQKKGFVLFKNGYPHVSPRGQFFHAVFDAFSFDLMCLPVIDSSLENLKSCYAESDGGQFKKDLIRGFDELCGKDLEVFSQNMGNMYSFEDKTQNAFAGLLLTHRFALHDYLSRQPIVLTEIPPAFMLVMLTTLAKTGKIISEKRFAEFFQAEFEEQIENSGINKAKKVDLGANLEVLYTQLESVWAFDKKYRKLIYNKGFKDFLSVFYAEKSVLFSFYGMADFLQKEKAYMKANEGKLVGGDSGYFKRIKIIEEAFAFLPIFEDDMANKDAIEFILALPLSLADKKLRQHLLPQWIIDFCKESERNGSFERRWGIQFDYLASSDVRDAIEDKMNRPTFLHQVKKSDKMRAILFLRNNLSESVYLLHNSAKDMFETSYSFYVPHKQKATEMENKMNLLRFQLQNGLVQAFLAEFGKDEAFWEEVFHKHETEITSLFCDYLKTAYKENSAVFYMRIVFPIAYALLRGYFDAENEATQ